MTDPSRGATRSARLRPWPERVWRGEGNRLATWTLRTLEPLYALGAAAARARARRTRRRVEGVRVIAIGGLTVGGAGKTTLARWAAREAVAQGLRPAVLLRGHGSEAASRPPEVVTFDAASASEGPRRFGDEAVAHRLALPAEALVLAGADRWAGAALARSQGAEVVILDDGWEQGSLAWDALWVAVDPLRPFGNGRRLPAGPLRRAPSHLHEADAVVVIAERAGEGATQLEAPLRHAVGPQPVIRFARTVESWTRLGPHPARAGAQVGAADAGAGSPAPPGPMLLASSVGSPERLLRFLEGAGVSVVEHLAFPDHASWDRSLLLRHVDRLRADGGAGVVGLAVTDKDARRAADLGDVGLPVWVVRSGLTPIDDPAPLRAALAGSAPPRPGAPMAGTAPFR